MDTITRCSYSIMLNSGAWHGAADVVAELRVERKKFARGDEGLSRAVKFPYTTKSHGERKKFATQRNPLNRMNLHAYFGNGGGRVAIKNNSLNRKCRRVRYVHNKTNFWRLREHNDYNDIVTSLLWSRPVPPSNIIFLVLAQVRAPNIFLINNNICTVDAVYETHFGTARIESLITANEY